MEVVRVGAWCPKRNGQSELEPGRVVKHHAVESSVGCRDKELVDRHAEVISFAFDRTVSEFRVVSGDP